MVSVENMKQCNHIVFPGESESKCENVTASRDADEETEDSEGGRGGLGLVSDTHSASFSLDTHGSSGEDRSSPIGDSMDRLDPGECSTGCLLAQLRTKLADITAASIFTFSLNTLNSFK